MEEHTLYSCQLQKSTTTQLWCVKLPFVFPSLLKLVIQLFYEYKVCFVCDVLFYLYTDVHKQFILAKWLSHADLYAVIDFYPLMYLSLN